MVHKMLQSVRLQRLWCAVTLGILAGVFAGCASEPTPPPSLALAANTSDTRVRAGNRLALAVKYFQDGKTDISLEQLALAISADPKWFEPYDFRGIVYMSISEFDLAEASFKYALELAPGTASVQHNYGRMLCKRGRMADGMALFTQALANPRYTAKNKTWMAKAECQLEAGQKAEAEASFLKAYEVDAANPFVGYNLGLLLYQRQEMEKARFYIRRLNNSAAANAESLWLGIKIERKLNNREAMAQLAVELKKRFPESREFAAFERGAFDE